MYVVNMDLLSGAGGHAAHNLAQQVLYPAHTSIHK